MIIKKKKIRHRSHHQDRSGSALILVVVLTVLLSIIGVLFVMASRLDEMASSSVLYNAELNAGVDTVFEGYFEGIGPGLVDDILQGRDIGEHIVENDTAVEHIQAIRAASLLGISRQTLRTKLKEYALEGENGDDSEED